MAVHGLSDEEYEVKLQQRRKVVLASEAEKQSVGRTTLSGSEIKDAPATFGDALNALTTLPGIVRSDVFFGQLIIRGAPDVAHRYFVDGIPIPRPQHFGGLHSVLSNDIIREANVYASAFPATFGGATGAILDFKTVDTVEKFGGVVDVGLLSANFLLKAPWSGDKAGAQGYWLASGRIGYLPLLAPMVYKAISGESLFALPQYYDYQLKGRLELDDRQRHSLSVLALGSYDVVKVLRDPSAQESALIPDFSFIKAGSGREISAHSLGLYYDYRPSRKMSNQLLLFNTFVADIASSRQYRSGVPDTAINYPNTTGLKNRFSFEWLEGIAWLNAGLEYSLYYFAGRGNYSELKYDVSSGRYLSVVIPFDERTVHHVPSGFVENRFQWGNMKFIPGVRADYLALNQRLAVGPRGLVAYEFSTQTTVELAGGVYQSFPQTNMAYMEAYLYQGYRIAKAAELMPEEAVHRSLAVSQRYKLWMFKVDGYLNNFYRQLSSDIYYSSATQFGNDGELQNVGAEFSVKKNAANTAQGDFFGWASYTLGRSGSRNYISSYDQTHVFKLVAGYLAGMHAISARIDIFSGFAYTPIVGSELNVYSSSDSQKYNAIYGQTQSARFPVAHRISLRYSQERTYAWGSWKWYVEVVNATNYAPLALQAYNYNEPYQAGVNPTLTHIEPKIPILPNFGVEVRF